MLVGRNYRCYHLTRFFDEKKNLVKWRKKIESNSNLICISFVNGNRFVFHDWRSDDFPVSQLDAQVVFMTMSEEDCCTVKNQAEGSSCTCRGMMNPGPTFVEMASKLLSKTFANLDSAGKATSLTAFTCQGESRRHIFYSAKKKLVK